jgi:hypothetical protein
MVIGSENKLKSKPSLDINIEGSWLSQTKSQLLRIYLDENLKWNVQIKYVCNRLQKQIVLLKRISYFLSTEMKEMFYNDYNLPCFDYCCIIWSTYNKTEFEKGNKLQKRSAKIILCKSVKTPSLQLFLKLNWLTFENRCTYHTAFLYLNL